MKRTMMAIAFFATMATANAQGKFEAAMEKGIGDVYKARTAEEFQASANYFERIANAEKEQWLPPYYSAYALIMKAFSGAPPAQMDELMNKADEMIAKADALKPGNSEVSVLKSMVLVVRMQVDQSRGMTLGPQATQLAAQALQQDGNNPRAHLQMAQMLYYTPAAFGGGKEAGMKSLQKSLDAFGTWKPSHAHDPQWGEEYAKQLQTEWSK